jgi:Zn-dependent M28 family amino/carboxypeptidase
LRLAGAALLAAALAGCGGEGGSGDGRDLFDAERAFEDLREQVAIGPRPAGSRGSRQVVRLIAGELREAGVRDVGVQRPHANVVGTIPGLKAGAVVIGAHHDTKDAIPGFVGANDGASGVAVVLELARSLQAPLKGPTVHLALFDAEEARGERDFALDGTRGSRQYVRHAAAGGRDGSPALHRVRAMVLFDMVGDCELGLPRETGYSDPELYALFAGASEEADGDEEPFTGTTAAIGDDHVPFAEAGVPTVDLIDFTFGSDTSPGPYWHTPEDTLDVVCASSLDAVGEAAMRAIPRIR